MDRIEEIKNIKGCLNLRQPFSRYKIITYFLRIFICCDNISIV